MIISFTNVIGAIQNVGKSIITNGLKMWLGFKTSEPLGREEVVNGDFALDSNWSEGAGWDIDTANNRITRTAQSLSTSASQNISFVSGKSYSITYTLDVSAGSFLIRLGGDGVKDTPARSLDDTYTEVVTASGNYTTLNLRALDGTFAGSISNVSVKELTQITPDLSGNSNVGQLFTGKALDFNGSTDSVDIDGFQLAGSDATFAFWVNPSQAQNKYILDITGDRFVIGFSGFELSIFSGDFFKFGVLAYSEWSRVAIVINGTSASCYVNGVQLGATKTIPAIDISSATRAAIGSVFTGAGTNYDGKLSDFQIYNAVWSADDIAYDYAKPNHLVTDNPSTSLTVSNLKAYWALTEGAGSIAYDSSGEGNNGIIDGATYTEHESKILQLGMVDYSISTPVSDEVTLVANPSNPSQDILGNSVRLREHAFNLDGSGYAEVADSDSLDINTAITLECWLYQREIGYSTIVRKRDGSNGFAWYVGNSVVKQRVFIGSIGAKNSDSYAPINQWNHLAVSYNGSTIQFYLNGVPDGSSDATGSIGINASVLTVGVDGLNSTKLDELLDEPRIYNRALTQEEITQNYNAGLPAHEAGSSFSDDFSSDYGN